MKQKLIVDRKKIYKRDLIDFMRRMDISDSNIKKWFARKRKDLNNMSPDQLIQHKKINIVMALLWDMATGSPS